MEDLDTLLLEPTLNELLGTDSMQWIFVGGKGGVGKTTTACSLAIQLAKIRESVLILSTDPAHNLSDAFTQKFTSSPTPVTGFTNLFAMEIDSSVQESMKFKLDEDDTTGFSKVLPELISAFPGIDEAMSFAQLMQAVQQMNYSVIVFDTAPTGHTLRLLSFPDLLEKAFKGFSALKDKMPGAFSMLNAVGGDMSQFSQFDKFRAVTTSVRENFRDPTKTTFVCVCIPEFLSVYETERLVQELAKQGIDSSHIVVNQVLFPIEGVDESTEILDLDTKDKSGAAIPEDVIESYQSVLKRLRAYENSYRARRKMQSKYLEQIRDLYSYDFHVVPMPLFPDEVRGLPHLNRFGEYLLKTRPLPILES